MIVFKWLAIIVFIQSFIFLCYLLALIYKDYMQSKREMVREFNAWEL